MKTVSKRFTIVVLTLIFLMSSISLGSAGGIQTAPVRNEDGYLGRSFNPDFDQMFDSFERPILETVEDLGLWWARTEGNQVRLTDRKGFLQSRYSTTSGTTKDAPIYKVASPSNTNGAYEFLVMVMRGFDGASIEDLYLSFRYDDNYEDIDVDFADLFDPDFDYLPELSEEFQVYIIDLNNSLDEQVFRRFPDRQGPELIPAGRSLAGFHFMAKSDGDGSGTIDIREVYWSRDAVTLGYADTPDNFLLDDFNREVLSETNPDIWWRGAGPDSQIIGKWLAFDYTTAPAVYMAAGYENSNAQGNYENFVLRAQGQEGGEDLLIYPFYVVDGQYVLGSPKALSELKGPDGEGVPALTAQMQNLVVNFTANGWDNKVNGFRFESKPDDRGLVYIDEIFFTNMEYDASQVMTEYPFIDPTDILVFDDFNRDALGATLEYDVNNPIALENDLQFIIAYAGIDRLSIKDGALVFDCTDNPDYIQYTTGGSRINDGSYQYVIFKMKGEEGASLSNFRISTIDENGTRSGVVWANGGLKSGPGLPTPQFEALQYPYVSQDGWTFLIVDLAASNLTETVSGFDLFYSGAGKLYIDTIFFANSGRPIPDYDSRFIFEDFNRDVLVPEGDLFEELGKWYIEGENAVIEGGAIVLDGQDNAYAYFKTAGYPSNFDEPKQYLILIMKGSENTTLESFRLSVINDVGESEFRFFNAGHLVSAPGIALPSLSTEYETFVIDLEASGLPKNAMGLIIAFGSWDMGRLYIDEISFADSVNPGELLNQVLEQ